MATVQRVGTNLTQASEWVLERVDSCPHQRRTSCSQQFNHSTAICPDCHWTCFWTTLTPSTGCSSNWELCPNWNKNCPNWKTSPPTTKITIWGDLKVYKLCSIMLLTMLVYLEVSMKNNYNDMIVLGRVCRLVVRILPGRFLLRENTIILPLDLLVEIIPARKIGPEAQIVVANLLGIELILQPIGMTQKILPVKEWKNGNRSLSKIDKSMPKNNHHMKLMREMIDLSLKMHIILWWKYSPQTWKS